MHIANICICNVMSYGVFSQIEKCHTEADMLKSIIQLSVLENPDFPLQKNS